MCFRRRRSRSRPRSRAFDSYDDLEPSEARTMLMTNAEAVHSLYGEISTERDGDLTHQCIQTNLADVICGGSIWLDCIGEMSFKLSSSIRKSQRQSHLCEIVETAKFIVPDAAEPGAPPQSPAIRIVETAAAMRIDTQPLEELCTSAGQRHRQQRLRLPQHRLFVAK